MCLSHSQLRALAVEHAFTVDAEPQLVQASRDSITLDAQGGHSPAVEHIWGGHKDSHQRVCGQHQALVHLQETQLPGLCVCVFMCVCEFGWVRKRRAKSVRRGARRAPKQMLPTFTLSRIVRSDELVFHLAACGAMWCQFLLRSPRRPATYMSRNCSSRAGPGARAAPWRSWCGPWAPTWTWGRSSAVASGPRYPPWRKFDIKAVRNF